jgi:ABC-type uncharacterized transport system auxiliary subunit
MMNLSPYLFRGLLPTLGLLLFAGCGNLIKQPAPQKQTFVLNPENPAEAPDADAPRLVVQAVRIAPAYEARNFIYRLGLTEFESDYYNNWLVSPAQLFQESLRAWLQDSGVVYVTDSSTMLKTQYVLETNVAELYGDYSGPSPAEWQAVMEVKFMVIPFRRDSDDLDTGQIVLTKSYRETVPLPDEEPATYAAAQTLALRAILTRFEADLREAL